MTLYNDSRDVIAHLRGYEVSNRLAGYDHFGPKMSAWRQEREVAEIATRDAASREPRGVTQFLRAIWFSIVRLSGNRQGA